MPPEVTASEGMQADVHRSHTWTNRQHENVNKNAGPDEEAAVESDYDPKYPQGIKLAIIVASLAISVFLCALVRREMDRALTPTSRLLGMPGHQDETIITTAIPKITDEFKSIQDVGWYGSA